MSIIIYIDTNVYIDYFEDRTDSMRPLGEFAFNVFKRTFACEFKIVFSDLILKELKQHISAERIEYMLAKLKETNKGSLIKVENSDIIEARALPTDYNDALHIILAEKAGAEFLVTRNISHFAGIGKSVKVKLPENL